MLSLSVLYAKKHLQNMTRNRNMAIRLHTFENQKPTSLLLDSDIIQPNMVLDILTIGIWRKTYMEYMQGV